ncbi:serine/threonine-protein phosphatase 6 regulatory ankyrin repeat subunit A isoform X2 [Halyomorpha halys]|uniref:serine/threonine-protein phosphatase 6 regulatory ankyrin repeat subunit A isoform X2 n=1 Tax=Halyomorpha halys TaxID=286706 RepID=UPI0006D526E7|nr:serine/threonine-protein phosphatase 6 regulatory ankyrin repeat subunit A-like isoform X2 [Halyomorpha halys]XP_024218982.1 serine/threonine-protein phosphatase 6 regulatory ankyrin repeat subunit A-like isoform X2 [Halyomorpha halys]
MYMMNSTQKEEDLWEAALNDNETVINMYEGDINAETPLGNTALHIAASGGCFNVVKALLDKGAKVDCIDKDALTPLFKAVQDNEELVAEYLISFGATTVGKDNTDMSLLHWAAKNGMNIIVEKLLSNKDLGRLQIVDLKDDGGKTPLHFACHYGHLLVVQQLLRFGANPSSKDEIHWTPLHEAAFWNNLSVVRYLLEVGADINPVTKDGETPLNFSHYSGNAAISEFLRRNGAIQ